MTADIDLSFVDPHRRDEVRRRIEVVRRFLASPGRAAALAAADELGMRITQFYALAKAWREHGDPAKLPGSGNRSARPMLSEAQKRVLDWADKEAADMDVSAAIRLAQAEGRRRHVAMPTAFTIRRHIKALREGTPPVPMPEADFVVDSCLLDLPVATVDAAVMPVMIAVVDIRGARVIGISLSIGPPNAAQTARALGDALSRRQLTLGGGGRILLDRPDTPDWSELAATLAGAGFEVLGETLPADAMERDVGRSRRWRNGRVITSVVGLRVAGVQAFVRSRPASDPGRHPHMKSGATALPLGKAEELVRARLGIGSHPTSSPDLDVGLAAQLARLADRS